MGLLEQERDSLLDKLVDYNKMLNGERIEREQLHKQIKVCGRQKCNRLLLSHKHV